MNTTYGQKGGTGPTAGRKARTYEAVAPDGSTLRKRSFVASAPAAILFAYQDAAGWHPVGVHDTDPGHLSHYTQLPARRVS